VGSVAGRAQPFPPWIIQSWAREASGHFYRVF
jgi:hypothetical protein